MLQTRGQIFKATDGKNKLRKQELWSNHGQHTEQEIVIETEPGQVLDANEGSQRMYAVTMLRAVQHFLTFLVPLLSCE